MLTLSEKSRFAELETIIETHLQQFFAVGQALSEINENRMYRAQFGNFEDYCQDRWGFGRSYAHRLIEAAAVLTEMSPRGLQLEPANEKQVRSLAKLPPEQRVTTWEASVEVADGQPTHHQIEQVHALRVAATVLDLDGEMDEGTLKTAFAQLKAGKDGYHCALADLIRVGSEKVGEDKVETMLADLEFEHNDAMRAEALNRLPPAARDLGLTPSHYVVVMQAKDLITEAQRMDWLKKAKKFNLTPLQLRRSIIAGRVVSNDDVQLAGGRNSGIHTLENSVGVFERYYRHVKKTDDPKLWSKERKDAALEKMGVVFTFLNDMSTLGAPSEP